MFGSVIVRVERNLSQDGVCFVYVEKRKPRRDGGLCVVVGKGKAKGFTSSGRLVVRKPMVALWRDGRRRRAEGWGSACVIGWTGGVLMGREAVQAAMRRMTNAVTEGAGRPLKECCWSAEREAKATYARWLPGAVTRASGGNATALL